MEELKKRREEQWEELKLLQSIIDKFDNISFRIKNWFITVFVAVTGYAIVKDEHKLYLLNFFIIFAFYSYEVVYRVLHRTFLVRSRKVQESLCENHEYIGPSLDGFKKDKGYEEGWDEWWKEGPKKWFEKWYEEWKDFRKPLLFYAGNLRVGSLYLLALILTFLLLCCG